MILLILLVQCLFYETNNLVNLELQPIFQAQKDLQSIEIKAPKLPAESFYNLRFLGNYAFIVHFSGKHNMDFLLSSEFPTIGSIAVSGSSNTKFNSSLFEKFKDFSMLRRLVFTKGALENIDNFYVDRHYNPRLFLVDLRQNNIVTINGTGPLARNFNTSVAYNLDFVFSYNKISYINPITFAIPFIGYIKLINNKLTSLEVGLFNNAMIKNIKRIDLSNNPFQCCQMWGLASDTIITQMDNYTCTLPDNTVIETNSTFPVRDFGCCNPYNGSFVDVSGTCNSCSNDIFCKVLEKFGLDQDFSFCQNNGFYQCQRCEDGYYVQFYLNNQTCLQCQQGDPTCGKYLTECIPNTIQLACEICVDEDVYTVENGTCIQNIGENISGGASNSNGSNVGLIVGVSVGIGGFVLIVTTNTH
eukprot:Pgem_evm2s6740